MLSCCVRACQKVWNRYSDTIQIAIVIILINLRNVSIYWARVTSVMQLIKANVDWGEKQISIRDSHPKYSNNFVFVNLTLKCGWDYFDEKFPHSEMCCLKLNFTITFAQSKHYDRSEFRFVLWVCACSRFITVWA